MNLLDDLLSSAGGGVVQQLTKQFGLDGNQTASALTALVPMVAGGLKDKIAGGGATGLMDMITGNSFQQFATDPSSLSSPAALEQGNSLLNQVFGGSDALSSLTGKAAETTGLGGSVLKSMLPVVASLAMGFISKSAAGNPNNAADVLSSLAGADATGILGTLKGLANKVFG